MTTVNLNPDIALGAREPSSVPPMLREHGAAARTKLYRDTLANGGSTVELATLKVPGKTNGYFVGGAVDYKGVRIPEVTFTREEFTQHKLGYLMGQMYVNRLTTEEYRLGIKPKGFMGTWMNEGVIYVDAVDWFETLEEAVRVGTERGELAIYDVAADGSLDLVPTAVQAVLV